MPARARQFYFFLVKTLLKVFKKRRANIVAFICCSDVANFSDVRTFLHIKIKKLLQKQILF